MMILLYFLIGMSRLFQNCLSPDEYYVLTNQKLLFASYETIVVRLSHIKIDRFDRSTGLHAARALQQCANVYRKIDTPEYLSKAIEYHRQALQLKNLFLSPDSIEIADNYVDIGATYNETKGTENNYHAIECYQKALAIYESKGDQHKRVIASTLHKLANAHRDVCSADRSRVLQAIDLIDRALSICSELSPDEEILKDQARMLYNQGVNYHLLQDTTRSLEFLKRAETIFKAQTDTIRYAITISYLAKVYLGEGEKQQAFEYLREAIRIFSSIYTSDHHLIQEAQELLQKAQE